MFGHGVFDIPLKTQFRGEDSDGNQVDEIWGDAIENLGMPDPRDYEDGDNFEDAEFQAAMEEWAKKMDQMREAGNNIFEGGPDAFNGEGKLIWCYNPDFGPYIYWKIMDKDEDGEYTVERASGKETATLFTDDEFEYLVTSWMWIEGPGNGGPPLTIVKNSCDEMGIKHESFNYGPSGGSGDAGDSNEDGEDEEPEDPSLKSYYLPIGLILAGGAAYYYKDQLIQVSKRIM